MTATLSTGCIVFIPQLEFRDNRRSFKIIAVDEHPRDDAHLIFPVGQSTTGKGDPNIAIDIEILLQ
jgi:hypothetical protein